MCIKLTVNSISRQEIYRYMGYRGHEPDEQIKKMTEVVLEELLSVIRPRNIYQIFKCKLQNDEIHLWNIDKAQSEQADIILQSKNLAENLKSCSYCIVMAATLGIESEQLLQRYEYISMTKAAMVQACGAACIENYCNQLQEKFYRQAQERKMYLRPRFSPGYGDLTLETQKIIFEKLECTKRLGLTLTQSLLMYPSKSVTALIGITKDEQACHIKKCKKCKNTECEFRYED